ncbi:hypothetical protein DFQ27_009814 [Actinomortierella ambigua]|uniref:C2H2-type domain-containing protein n=1 Tax=Actinomortierella ambigua TaxID=1343610 RepID=A0A9P6TX39_9FUNG|nr:hypothetical protein DFQ27_009814 [Actinomortierella ambigua]
MNNFDSRTVTSSAEFSSHTESRVVQSQSPHSNATPDTMTQFQTTTMAPQPYLDANFPLAPTSARQQNQPFFIATPVSSHGGSQNILPTHQQTSWTDSASLLTSAFYPAQPIASGMGSPLNQAFQSPPFSPLMPADNGGTWSALTSPHPAVSREHSPATVAPLSLASPPLMSGFPEGYLFAANNLRRHPVGNGGFGFSMDNAPPLNSNISPQVCQAIRRRSLLNSAQRKANLQHGGEHSLDGLDHVVVGDYIDPRASMGTELPWATTAAMYTPSAVTSQHMSMNSAHPTQAIPMIASSPMNMPPPTMLASSHTSAWSLAPTIAADPSNQSYASSIRTVCEPDQQQEQQEQQGLHTKMNFYANPSAAEVAALMSNQQPYAVPSANRAVAYPKKKSPPKRRAPTKKTLRDTGFKPEVVPKSAMPGNATKGPRVCLYPKCGKEFTRQYNLQSHTRTHSDERPFVCRECGKAFGRKHDMDRHRRCKHLKQRPYKCLNCLYGFERPDALKRHLGINGGNNNCNTELIKQGAAMARPIVPVEPKGPHKLIMQYKHHLPPSEMAAVVAATEAIASTMGGDAAEK